MNGNSIGTAIGASVMSAGTIGTGITWQVGYPTPAPATAPGMTVGASHTRLPGDVIVNGTTYPAGYSTQSIAYDNATSGFSAMQANIPTGHTAITVAGYITFPPADPTGNVMDLVRVDLSGHFCILQPNNSTFRNGGNPNSPYGVHVHSDGNGTLYSSDIQVTPGQTYWYSMKCDFGVRQGTLNMYDINGNLLGNVSVLLSAAGASRINRVLFGNIEIGKSPGNSTYFENTLIDYTNAAFPLVASPSSDSVPPNPPVNLRVKP
jgi:hypothetical protein